MASRTMALVQPKKPVGGAYGSFLAEKRPEFTKACAGQKASAISTMAGEAWKKLGEAQKAPFQKAYEAQKAQFDKDMAAFLAGGGVKAKGEAALRKEKKHEKEGKTKKTNDPDAPKKPVAGGYGVFLAENRAKISASLPVDHKILDVAKAAGSQWKGLTPAAKKPYEATFQKKQAAYKAAMEEWKKTHGADAAEDEGDEEAEEEEEKPAPKKKARKAGA